MFWSWVCLLHGLSIHQTIIDDCDRWYQVTVALNNYKAFSAFPTMIKRRIAETGWYERSVTIVVNLRTVKCRRWNSSLYPPLNGFNFHKIYTVNHHFTPSLQFSLVHCDVLFNLCRSEVHLLLLTYVTLLRRPTYMRINIVTQLLGSEETRHLGQLSLLSLRGR